MATKKEPPLQNKHDDFGLPNIDPRPIATEGRKWLQVIMAMIGLTALMGTGIVYWFLYKRPMEAPSVVASTTPATLQSKVTNTEKETVMQDHGYLAQCETTSSDTMAPSTAQEVITPQQQATVHEVKKVASKIQPPSLNTRTVVRICQPRGYYVIAGSFIDEDLAIDFSRRLAKPGSTVMLIAPSQAQHYFRVAIKKTSTNQEAIKTVTDLRAIYGTGLWVTKY